MAKKSLDNPFAALDKSRFPKDKKAQERAAREKRAQERAKAGAGAGKQPPAPKAASPPKDDDALFLSAMDGVAPLQGEHGRAVAPDAPAPPGKADNSLIDHESRQALHDLVNGKIEFELHFTSEYIEAHVSGINPRLLARLKAGQLNPESHLDLHGCNAAQAWQLLSNFLREGYLNNKRSLLLIPGRGKNSPEGYGVLREKVQSWLTQDPFKRVVLAFCTAKPRHGGAGALYVLLRKYRKDAGKILWERMPLDDDLF